VARLGPRAFETISGEVVNVALLSLTNRLPEETHELAGLDVSAGRNAADKAQRLLAEEVVCVSQAGQLGNPDGRVVLENENKSKLLNDYSKSYWGLGSGDYPRFGRVYWEKENIDKDWIFQLSTIIQNVHFGGREHILYWQEGKGELVNLPGAFVRGIQIWGKQGVHLSQMRNLPVTIYTGECWDSNSAPIIPENPSHLPAIWCFCSSPEYNTEVRKIDQKLNVTNATLVKVPFDLERWQKVAAERYPDGLPEPCSNDPTQWLFHGHPFLRVAEPEAVAGDSSSGAGAGAGGSSLLQIAVARLMGYRWPAELDSAMRLSQESRRLVQCCEELLPLADEDGIACIPSVRGEEPAVERLRVLLKKAFGAAWSENSERELVRATLAAAGKSPASTAAIPSLDTWLRDEFFEQHCKLFHHRPFVWHIWDGRRRDGFHSLINYHKLAEGEGRGKKVLENLTYSYLGDWINRQKDGVRRGESGADDRLAAATELQNRLIKILEGEPPFDIFVRWKPLSQQPIGWEPDINDGVRLNIRPFLAGDLPNGRKGAGILRWQPNIKWEKDRGREPQRPQEEYPWFWENGNFTGNRVNEVHLTNRQKREARATKEGK